MNQNEIEQNEINQNEEVTKGRNIKLLVVLAILSLCAVFFAIFLWGDKAGNHAYANQEAEFEVAANHASIKSVETEATSHIVEETSVETTTPQNSEEPKFVTEFEITDWTMEELVSNINIEGNKFSLPCTISEIDLSYKLENINYFEDMQKTAGVLCKNNKEIGLVYFNNDIKNNALNTEIKYLFLGGTYDLPTFNIMGITDKSTRSDVISILGNPNMRVEHSDEVLQYGFSKDKYILIWFDEEKTDEIYLFYIIYNVED